MSSRFKKIIVFFIIISLLLPFDVFAKGVTDSTSDYDLICSIIDGKQPVKRNSSAEKAVDEEEEELEQLINDLISGNIEISVPVGDIAHPVIDSEKVDMIERRSKRRSKKYPYLLAYGKVSKDDYKEFSVYLKTIENEETDTLNAFVSDGWRIVLIKDDLDSLLFDGNTENVVGCTIPDYKMICIETGSTSFSILHEFGHYVDFKKGYISETDEFKELYNRNKNTIGKELSEYAMTDEGEFFAEAYMFMLLDSKLLKRANKETYDYMRINKSL